MVQSVFDEDKCMFTKTYLFSVDQQLSLIFLENKNDLIIISDFKTDIRIMRRSAFPQF